MSSHREAPEISKDPVADNTDVYAFVSPDKPDTVTLITNFVPLQDPPGGPNFFEFGDDVLYAIHIDNDGDGIPEISYMFEFTSRITNPDTFLYNTGPITSLNSPNWNRRQFYSVTRVEGSDTRSWGTAKANGRLKARVLGQGLACPPCNIGPRSTPNYGSLAQAATYSLPGGTSVFAGQRLEGFYVDLGAVFDLGDLRPFQNLHVIPTPAAPGVDATKDLNIHTIALQVPIEDLAGGWFAPGNASSPHAVIGVWSSASRRMATMLDGYGDPPSETGPWIQVSRLGNPLFNEVLVPMSKKDNWNSQPPVGDKAFAQYVQHPELAGLLPALYPGVFPNLAGLTAARADLVAILLTGIPSGIIPGFQNYTGAVQADQLRLNMAIPPASSPNRLGLLGGDLAGFPNGRRVSDDIVAIELRAVAGVTYPLIDSSYTPDAAAGLLQQFEDSQQDSVPGADRYLSSFPYLGTPADGYDTPAS